MKSNSVLNKLVNQRLYEVIFVEDYLQVGFDDCIFSFYIMPNVQVGEHLYKENTPGYRDVLCSLINSRVINVYNENHFVKLVFHNDTELTLLLDQEALNGLEFGEIRFNNGHDIIVI